MWIYHDKSALRGRRNLSQGSEEILKVVVLPLVVCCISFYVPNMGLLIPKGGRRRPQGDETSLVSRNSLGFSMSKSRLSSKFLGWRITCCLSSSSSSFSLEDDIFWRSNILFTSHALCLQVTCD